MGARIMAVAESFDTITNNRIYRANPLTAVDAIRDISEHSASPPRPTLFPQYELASGRVVDPYTAAGHGCVCQPQCPSGMTAIAAQAHPTLSHRSAWARAVGSMAALFIVNLAITVLMRLVANLTSWPSDVHGRAAVVFGAGIVGEVLFLVLFIWWLSKQGLTLADLGVWKRPKPWALAVALTFALGYGVLTASNPGLRPYLGIHDLLKAEAVVAAIVFGTVEEVVSRGYFMFELQRSGTPVALQILGSGVVFGIVHFNYSVYGVVSTFVLGLVFALIYHFGKRSLAPVIAGHALIDLIIEPALILWVLSGFPIPH